MGSVGSLDNRIAPKHRLSASGGPQESSRPGLRWYGDKTWERVENKYASPSHFRPKPYLHSCLGQLPSIVQQELSDCLVPGLCSALKGHRQSHSPPCSGISSSGEAGEMPRGSEDQQSGEPVEVPGGRPKASPSG